ncbi:MAG: hypothetical protein ACLQDL_07585 [Spirochaetia bacterium]
MRALSRATRRFPLFLALLCALALIGCGSGRILFSFEQPFWSSIGGGRSLRAALAGAAAVHGYFPRVDVGPVGTDASSALAANLASGKYAAAVVGPLLSFEWSTFVSKFPDTRFVLIDVPVPSRDLPSNAVYLDFDRTGAFREAGRAAGESVRGRFGAAEVSPLGQRIAVLTSQGSDLTREETEAFTRGVAEALDGGQPVTRTFASPLDPTGTRAAVDEMRRAGVEIFLLGLGENDPLGLEALHDAGGAAVLADWQVSRAFPAQVLLSIEEDVPGGIRRALDALRAGVPLVQGPVKLVSGKKI